MEKLITVEEAEEIILTSIPLGPTERVPIEKATGRVLAEPIIADRPLPPFDRSMMDGIAVQFKSIKRGFKTFDLKRTIYAGDPIPVFENPPPLQSYLEIMTGAAVPKPFDCIIPIEDLKIEETRAVIISENEIKPKQFIHQKSSDYNKGEILLESGSELKSPQLPIAASCGYDTLTVQELPSVAVITTGDELVEISHRPSPTQIRRSNHLALLASLHSLGVSPHISHLPDSVDDIEKALPEILERHTFIILSGGISKGKKDYLAHCLSKMGVEKKLHGVRQRPGKPFWFGTNENNYIFALPGNPVSTLACSHRYLLPAIEKYLGITTEKRLVSLQEDVSFSPPLQYFLPVQLDGLQATPTPVRNSGDYASIAKTDGFIELMAYEKKFPKAKNYRFYPWR